jgi:hypothetical protein
MVKKAAKKKVGGGARAAVGAGPAHPPIYISGPNGELERCDWDAALNRYVCRPIQDAPQVPAGALHGIRVAE